MNYDEIVKELAEVAHAFSVPINFEKLMSDGVLKKIGRSYYVKNIRLLPEPVRNRIKSIAGTNNGLMVTFYKESVRS